MDKDNSPSDIYREKKAIYHFSFGIIKEWLNVRQREREFLELLHIEYQNTHSTNKVKTFLENVDTFGGSAWGLRPTLKLGG